LTEQYYNNPAYIRENAKVSILLRENLKGAYQPELALRDQGVREGKSWRKEQALLTVAQFL
jgi:hypothetical protein